MVIYISNLGKKVTVDSLELLFSTHGNVSSTRLLYNMLHAEHNGQALVEMAHGHEAERAIGQLNGSIIDGQILAVSSTDPSNWVERLRK